MNFEAGYVFQNVPKIIAFALNTLVLDQTIFNGFKTKILSWYKLVIWKIELSLHFEQSQSDVVEAMGDYLNKM